MDFFRKKNAVPEQTPVPAQRPQQPAAPARPAPAQQRPAAQAPARPAAQAPVPAPSASAAPQAPTDGRARLREASRELVQQILDFKGSVLTAPGGVAEISDAQAQYVAMLENHILVVSKSHAYHHDVSSVRSLLRRKGITWRSEYLVELSVIRRIYERVRDSSPVVARPDQASRQRDFIDLLGRAAKVRASDIHLTVRRYEAIVEIRAAGIVQKIDDMNSGAALEMCQAAYAMAAAGEADAMYMPMEPQQARLSETSLNGMKFPDGVQSVRLQFNPLPGGGRYMIARLLYNQKVGSDADVDTLGYAPVHIRQIRTMRRKPYGINIFAGPTGSGKSTSLQRGLTALGRERPGINIITIEDPPEYVIDVAKQIPVTNAPTAEARAEKFRQAITAALRSDPDVIMIGEIRDAASAQLAFEAAMTGHGVWASLHANNAASIVERLRDQHVEVYKLCDATLVTGLIGQRLVRTTNPAHTVGFSEAAAKGLIDGETAEFLAKHAGRHVDGFRFADLESYRNEDDAYTGRTVVAETICPDQDFLDFFREERKAEAVKHWLDKLDGMTLLEHAFVKMCEGLVDPREVEGDIGIITSLDPDRIRDLVRMAGAAS